MYVDYHRVHHGILLVVGVAHAGIESTCFLWVAQRMRQRSMQQQNIAALRKQALDVGWDRAAKVAEAGIKEERREAREITEDVMKMTENGIA